MLRRVAWMLVGVGWIRARVDWGQRRGRSSLLRVWRGAEITLLRKRVRGRATQVVLTWIHWERGAAGIGGLRAEAGGSLLTSGSGVAVW